MIFEFLTLRIYVVYNLNASNYDNSYYLYTSNYDSKLCWNQYYAKWLYCIALNFEINIVQLQMLNSNHSRKLYDVWLIFNIMYYDS